MFTPLKYKIKDPVICSITVMQFILLVVLSIHPFKQVNAGVPATIDYLLLKSTGEDTHKIEWGKDFKGISFSGVISSPTSHTYVPSFEIIATGKGNKSFKFTFSDESCTGEFNVETSYFDKKSGLFKYIDWKVSIPWPEAFDFELVKEGKGKVKISIDGESYVYDINVRNVTLNIYRGSVELENIVVNENELSK